MSEVKTRKKGKRLTCDTAKLKELILYVANKSEDDPRFGATKLNKILYYADFAAYRTLGKSITGADYQNLSEGPAPKQLLLRRNELLKAGDAVVERRQYYDGVQQRLIAHRPPDPEVFSEEELAIVDQVIDDLWDKNGTEVSHKSHKELGWLLTKRGEAIPYASAFFTSQDTPLTEEQEKMGRTIARRHGLLV